MAATPWPRQPRFGERGWWNRRRRAGVVAAVTLVFAGMVVLGQADGWWGSPASSGGTSRAGGALAPRPSLADDLLAAGSDGLGAGGGVGPIAAADAAPDADADADADAEVDVGPPGPLDPERLLAVGAVDGCAAEPGGDPVVVGVVADEPLGRLPEADPSTDPLTVMAARHVVDLVNCAGGVGGRAVEVVAVGAGGSPLASREAVVDLLGRDPVALIGPTSLEVGLRSAETVGAAVPLLFPLSADPVFDDAGRGRFLLGPDRVTLARAAARHALDEGWSTAVAFTAVEPGDRAAVSAFVEAFEAGGGVVRSELTVVSREDGTVDLDGQLGRLGVGSGIDRTPDVIFTGSWVTVGPALAAALVEVGVDSPVLAVDHRTPSGGVVGEASGGRLVGRPLPTSAVDDFASSYRGSTGVELSDPLAAARVADAVLLVLGAIERTGITEASAIADEIGAGPEVAGLIGPVGVWSVSAAPMTEIPIVEFTGDAGVELVATVTLGVP